MFCSCHEHHKYTAIIHNCKIYSKNDLLYFVAAYQSIIYSIATVIVTDPQNPMSGNLARNDVMIAIRYFNKIDLIFIIVVLVPRTTAKRNGKN